MPNVKVIVRVPDGKNCQWGSIKNDVIYHCNFYDPENHYCFLFDYIFSGKLPTRKLARCRELEVIPTIEDSVCVD